MLYNFGPLNGSVLSTTMDSETRSFTCDGGGVIANFVKATLPGTDCLHFVEIAVHGTPVGE